MTSAPSRNKKHRRQVPGWVLSRAPLLHQAKLAGRRRDYLPTSGLANKTETRWVLRRHAKSQVRTGVVRHRSSVQVGPVGGCVVGALPSDECQAELAHMGHVSRSGRLPAARPAAIAPLKLGGCIRSFPRPCGSREESSWPMLQLVFDAETKRFALATSGRGGGGGGSGPNQGCWWPRA